MCGYGYGVPNVWNCPSTPVGLATSRLITRSSLPELRVPMELLQSKILYAPSTGPKTAHIPGINSRYKGPRPHPQPAGSVVWRFLGKLMRALASHAVALQVSRLWGSSDAGDADNPAKLWPGSLRTRNY